MNVLIQTVHFVADEKLTQLVTQKAKKLNHFHDGITKIEIFLKTRQCSAPHQRQGC